MAKLAINGGKKVREGKSFPTWPVVTDLERKAVLDVLNSGKWWQGAKVKEFEEKYAAFQDAKYGIACVNGTTALEIACVAAGIGAIAYTRTEPTGEVLGCTGESGVCGAMAAAAIAEMVGGSPEAVENAASLALQAFMGLPCDPMPGGSGFLPQILASEHFLEVGRGLAAL